MIYRGFDIQQESDGLWSWTDERGVVHNGKVDTRGGYKTEEEAMNAIDIYKRKAAQ